jgi:hypothetical protein
MDIREGQADHDDASSEFIRKVNAFGHLTPDYGEE